MSIRPLDMQVMVPKLQEVAHMKQLEQQKSRLEQQQISNTLNKDTDKEQKSVAKTVEDQSLGNHADAKEKGKNTYYQEKKDKADHKEEENSKNNFPRNKIDIKI